MHRAAQAELESSLQLRANILGDDAHPHNHAGPNRSDRLTLAGLTLAVSGSNVSAEATRRIDGSGGRAPCRSMSSSARNAANSSRVWGVTRSVKKRIPARRA